MINVKSILWHALAMQCTRNCIYSDSKLVIYQLSVFWKCRATNLQGFYEQGLAMVRQLQAVCVQGSFTLGHIHREFNGNADSLANAAIDQSSRNNNIVIDD